jgi:hypothetical protein
MKTIWPHTLSAKIKNLPKSADVSIDESRISILLKIESPYAIIWAFDLDRGVIYPSISLGVYDKEDGWLFHSTCEINSDISYRLARSISIEPRKAKAIYLSSHQSLSIIENFISEFKSSLSKQITINNKINPDILYGIVRFDNKDYRNWSEVFNTHQIKPESATE